MADFSTVNDSGDIRGLCKGCKWWQAEHDGPRAEDAAIGLCMHAELTHFSLQVTGHSGCNRYEPRPDLAAGQLAAGAAKG